MFDTGAMAGGMGRGRGLPIGLRPTFIGEQKPERRAELPRRHVWVAGAGGGPHPGLIHQWERRGQDWWALVTWVVVDDGMTHQQWLPSRLIQPA
jgi:hypothetical protein